MTVTRFAKLMLLLIPGCLNAQVRTYQNQNYTIQNLTKDRSETPHYFLAVPPVKSEAKSFEDTVRIIVRLKTSPLLTMASSGGRSMAEFLEQEHDDFLEYLNGLDEKSKSGRSTHHPAVILAEYRNTFNGFALITTHDISEKIKNYKSVHSVFVSKQVKAIDNASNDVIGAPLAWSEHNVTGEGITIGVIDTGIDYLHPLLGGGFGPAFKVVGGYDFFNNDNDPMDDNGHGTHVAGIAAGDSPDMKGVAPGAKLVAYKVLGAQGFGYDDMIMAAIERTTDPDQNPLTDDALDVVNMSLGRYADATEPYSEAVNNAVAAGVTFVVAAGNSYDLFTVGTPGIADKAITVGAVDNNKITANFSSKGPVERTFNLKPDVAAPGVQINSSIPNNSFASFDGTSMASPHVAGAAALILQKHADWSPQDVKAALMNNSSSGIFSSIWEQGSGVINIPDAIQTGMIVSPGSISLGKPGQSSATWTRNVPLTVKNKTTSTRTYSLSATGDIQSGAISTEFSQAAFVLTAGEEKELTVTFRVTMGNLSIKSIPDAYIGSVVISDGFQTVSSIVTMVNPQVTTVKFTNEQPSGFLFLGIDGTSYYKVVSVTGPEMPVYLPFGKFDILAYYQDNSMVIHEGVNTNFGDVQVVLDKSMAKNTISFNPVDKDGKTLLTSSTVPSGVAVFTSKRADFLTLFPGFLSSLKMSDQDSYVLSMSFNGKGANDSTFYEIVGSSGYGIKESKVISNDPSAFNAIKVHNPSLPVSGKQALTFYSRAGMQYFYMNSWNSFPIEVRNPLTVYQNNSADAPYILGSLELAPSGESPGYVWQTPHMKSSGENVVFYNHFSDKIDSASTPFNLYLGESIISPNAFIYAYGNSVALYDMPTKGIFRRSRGEREIGNVSFKFFSNGSLAKSGIIYNGSSYFTSADFLTEAVPADLKFDLEYKDYQVSGMFGKITASYHFDTRNWDANPPTLTKLSLKVNGEETCEIPLGSQGFLRLGIIDHCSNTLYCSSSGLATTKLQYKKHGANSWTDLDLVPEGNYFLSSLPSDLTTGFYDLRITAADVLNNSLTTEIAPAFSVGEQENETSYSTVKLISPKNHSINAGTAPLFQWSHLIGADYVFEISEAADFTNAQQFSTSELDLSLPEALTENQTYYWRVKAQINGSETPWSPFFTLTATTLYPPVSLYPANAATNQPTTFVATWTAVSSILYYTFELSTTADFSVFVRMEYPSTNALEVSNLAPFETYYWRVTAVVWTISETIYLPSETGTFSTGKNGDVTGIEDKERIQRWHAAPNPFSISTLLKGSSAFAESALLVVHDQVGREVFRKSIFLNEGANVISYEGISAGGAWLPNGIYTAFLISEGQKVQTMRLSINR